MTSLKGIIIGCITFLMGVSAMLIYLNQQERYALCQAENGIFVFDRKNATLNFCDSNVCRMIRPIFPQKEPEGAINVTGGMPTQNALVNNSLPVEYPNPTGQNNPPFSRALTNQNSYAIPSTYYSNLPPSTAQIAVPFGATVPATYAPNFATANIMTNGPMVNNNPATTNNREQRINPRGDGRVDNKRLVEQQTTEEHPVEDHRDDNGASQNDNYQGENDQETGEDNSTDPENLN